MRPIAPQVRLAADDRELARTEPRELIDDGERLVRPAAVYLQPLSISSAMGASYRLTDRFFPVSRAWGPTAGRVSPAGPTTINSWSSGTCPW
jgi:hypothetical protein